MNQDIAQTMHELQSSSEIHQANRELAEGRLRRLVVIEDALRACMPHCIQEDLLKEREEILSHYREPKL